LTITFVAIKAASVYMHYFDVESFLLCDDGALTVAEHSSPKLYLLGLNNLLPAFSFVLVMHLKLKITLMLTQKSTF